MSENDSNNQTTDAQDPTDIQNDVQGINWSNIASFNNQSTNLKGLQPSFPSGFQFENAPYSGAFQPTFFQQAPYSAINQPTQSISFRQLTPPGPFQFNNYFPPQTTQSFTQSLVSPLPNSTPNLNNNPESSKKARKKTLIGGTKLRNVWTTEEDIELCVAWSKITEDPIVGTNQPKCAFWARITKQFNTQSRARHDDHVERSVDACNSRWRLIHPAVTKWSGILAYASRDVPSGWNESLIESQARSTYKQTYGEHFVFEECWKVLQDCYKWKKWSKKNGESIASERPTSSKRKYVSVNNPAAKEYEIDTPSPSLDTEAPQSVTTDTQQSVSVDIPESVTQVETSTAKSVAPPLYGPNHIKRPMGVKRAKNARQRAKQQFVELQNEGVDKISATLLTIEKDVDKRACRAEEARNIRDEVMRLHLEAEINRAKEDQMLKKQQHLWIAGSKRVAFVKDLLYVTEKLKDARRQLDLIEHSSLKTPIQKSDYDGCKELVEVLESERTELKKLLATIPVVSLEPRTTSIEEPWNVDLEAD